METQTAIDYLTRDGGRVPCSRYGYDSHSCAPVAYAAAVILAGEAGAEPTLEECDFIMGLVVNDHDDPEYLIRNYGPEYGFDPEDLLGTPNRPEPCDCGATVGSEQYYCYNCLAEL